MNGDSELDPYTEALREDLPSAHDEARLRVRLASAGILAGASVMTPAGTAAATGGAATAGVFAKLVALPLAVKVGAALALASVALVPLVPARPPVTQAKVGAPARTLATAALLPRTTQAPRPVEAVESAETRAPAPSVALDARVSPAESKREEAPSALVADAASRGSNRAARDVTPARGAGTESVAAAPSSLPAVAAFPGAPPASEDEGTLRAETAVMERALAAMKQGDFGTAQRELALHAAQFPNGHLAPERDRALARIREKTTP